VHIVPPTAIIEELESLQLSNSVAGQPIGLNALSKMVVQLRVQHTLEDEAMAQAATPPPSSSNESEVSSTFLSATKRKRAAPLDP